MGKGKDGSDQKLRSCAARRDLKNMVLMEERTLGMAARFRYPSYDTCVGGLG